MDEDIPMTPPLCHESLSWSKKDQFVTQLLTCCSFSGQIVSAGSHFRGNSWGSNSSRSLVWLFCAYYSMAILPASILFQTSGFPHVFPAASLSQPCGLALFIFPSYFHLAFPWRFPFFPFFKLHILVTCLFWATPLGIHILETNLGKEEKQLLHGYELCSLCWHTSTLLPHSVWYISINFILLQNGAF